MKPYLFLLLLLLVPLSSASYGTFKYGQNITLAQTCDNGLTICTSCNITNIKNPNSDVILHEVVMIKGAADFRYSFDNTSMFGVYTVTGSCWDATTTLLTNWIYHFTVQSASPAEDNTSIFIAFGFLALGLLIFALVMKNYIFSILSGFAFLGLGVYGMINGIVDITNVYTKMVSLIIIGFGAIITIVSGLELLSENSDWRSMNASNDDED